MIIPRGEWLIIRTDGTEEWRTDKPTSDVVHAAIGAELFDTVLLDKKAMTVMLVDDEGYDTEPVDHGNGVIELKCVRARKPVNERATRLYHAVCLPGTTHQIVGDVAIVNDNDF